MAIFAKQLQLVSSPRTTITDLANNPRAAIVGFEHVLVLAVLYELAFVLWALGEDGSFDTLLGGLGIAALTSAYFTLIPDFVQGALWTSGWVPFTEYQEATSRGPLLVLVWGYILAYNVSHLLLYTVTIRYSQNLGI